MNFSISNRLFPSLRAITLFSGNVIFSTHIYNIFKKKLYEMKNLSIVSCRQNYLKF